MNRIYGKLMAGITGLMFLFLPASGQQQINTADRLMQEEVRLTMGGYAQIDYNQPLSRDLKQEGILDVHRLVLMFGYKFNARTQFVTEVEFEHVKEVYVEQAFLQYEILPWLKFKGGLMLVPMGIINEYHEPSTFNGVERPNVDKYIVPTTWREIGAGFSGVFPAAAISYQLYMMNGFNGYDGGALLNGADGFRPGRQKGAESLINTPSLALRSTYNGIPGLQLGLSWYSGRTRSSLKTDLDKRDTDALATADSSVVGLNMFGADARIVLGGLQLRSQINYGIVDNSPAYNTFTGSDLGSALLGWYGEGSYNLFQSLQGLSSELILFLRFEQYFTHAAVAGSLAKNESFNRSDLTFGLGWKLDKGAMLKLDHQIFQNNGPGNTKHQFNAGVAVWF